MDGAHHAGMDVLASPASVEKLLEELVANHQHAAGPQFMEQGLLPQLESEVGVPVKAPNLKQYGARWEGREHRAGEQPARGFAALPHRWAPAHRLHLRCFARGRCARRLEQRLVRDEPV